MASDMNKSKRQFFLNDVITSWNHRDCVVGAKLQQDIRTWLSPPDPWKNHNIACGSRHPGTAAWFVQGDTFSEWKSSVPNSLLLWVHGKRQLPPSSCTFVEADRLPLRSGRREKCVLVCVILFYFFLGTYGVSQFHNHRGDRCYAEIWPRVTRFFLL